MGQEVNEKLFPVQTSFILHGVLCGWAFLFMTHTNDFLQLIQMIFCEKNEPKFPDFEKFFSSEIAIFRQSVSTCHKKYGRIFFLKKNIFSFLSGLWPNS